MTSMPSARDAAPPAHALAVAAALPDILREVDALLAGWHARAQGIPDPELRRQALASLTRKRFHCEGGAVYALAAGRGRASALRYIVALQTISDYLDNLCDRSTPGGGRDFARLHAAMLDAALGKEVRDPAYYALHAQTDDGGYLAALVATCGHEVAALPPEVREAFVGEACPLVEWYCTLQVRKHLPEGREAAVREWAETLRTHAPGLAWWEIAAATGSTLGLFALFAAAAARRLDQRAAGGIRAAYFPAVTGLHILLDYWIDREEDADGGDMNFTFHYRDAAEGARRLRSFGRQAQAAVRGLPDAGFHRAVASGLPALYLADPKVGRQGLRWLAWDVLRTAGPASWLFHWAVRLLRARRLLRAVAP